MSHWGCAGRVCRNAPQNRIRESARALRRETHRLRDGRVFGDVHEHQLIRADAQHVADLRLDLAFRIMVDREIESRSPAKDAEDDRADGGRLADENERREERLALDAAIKMQRALTLIHDDAVIPSGSEGSGGRAARRTPRPDPSLTLGVTATPIRAPHPSRSEERRVGKEGRSRW